MFCKSCGKELVDGVCPACECKQQCEQENTVCKAKSRSVSACAVIGITAAVIAFVMPIALQYVGWAVLGMALGLASTIFGAVALSKAKKTGNGKGAALAALLCGIGSMALHAIIYISSLLTVVFVVGAYILLIFLMMFLPALAYM